jgi:pentachlorophenol monooxygenase/3-(3-hydroxy-phenyl)propionate hydroxylase
MCYLRLFVQVLGKVSTAPLAVREHAATDGTGGPADRPQAGSAAAAP